MKAVGPAAARAAARAGLLVLLLAPAALAAAEPPPDAVAVEEALAGLKTGDWVLRARAMAVLGRARAAEAVAPLREVVGGKDHPWIRGRALVALAQVLGPEAVAEAARLAADPSPELRAAAVEALGLTGAPGAAATVEARLADPAPGVRHQATVALARLRRAKAWPHVAPLLADADPVAVRHAARALVHVATPDARQALVALLAHADEGVRVAAAQALREVRDPEAIATLLKGMTADSAEDVKSACYAALGAYDAQALAWPLLEALGSRDTALQASALRVVRVRPSDEAKAGLATLLATPADRTSTFVLAALDVLAGSDPDPYRETFARYLEDTQSSVRTKAIEYLSQCPSADHFALLGARRADAEESVRVAALKALRRSPRPAPPGGIVEYLAPALKEPAASVLEYAVPLLGDRLTAPEVPRALEVLDPILAGADEGRRAKVVEALDRFAAADVAPRVAAAQGYLTRWMVLGPFPNAEGRGLAALYPPELEVDFTKAYARHELVRGATFLDGASPRAWLRRLSAGAPAVVLRPPHEDGATGRVVAAYTLDLPDARDVRLSAKAWAAVDGSTEGTAGARLTIAADGRRLLERELPVSAEGGEALDVPLADWAGRRVQLDLVAESLAQSKGEWVVLADARVLAAGQVAADLVKSAPTAAVRSVLRGEEDGRMAWQPVRAVRPSGEVDLGEVVEDASFRLAYAVADVESPDDRKVTLTVSADDAVRAWLNGAKVAERTTTGTARVEVDLRKGANRLVLKVANEHERWYFSVRLSDAEGRRIDGLTSR